MSVTLSPVGGAGAQFFDNNGNPLSGGKLYTYAAGTTTPVSTYTSAAGSTLHTNPIVLDSAGRVPGSSEIWLTDGVIYKFLLKTSVDVTLATWDNITGVNSNFVNFTAESEYQTATAGQTVFTLTTMTYSPGTGNLTVYVDGVNQYLGTSYVETDGATVTFTAGLHVGALVKFTTAVETTGNATDASVVTYTPAGTGAVTTTVQAKLRETVSVKDFGAVGDGVTDDSVAVQNAVDSIPVNGGIVSFAGITNIAINAQILVKKHTLIDLHGCTVKTTLDDVLFYFNKDGENSGNASYHGGDGGDNYWCDGTTGVVNGRVYGNYTSPYCPNLYVAASDRIIGFMMHNVQVSYGNALQLNGESWLADIQSVTGYNVPGTFFLHQLDPWGTWEDPIGVPIAEGNGPNNASYINCWAENRVGAGTCIGWDIASGSANIYGSYMEALDVCVKGSAVQMSNCYIGSRNYACKIFKLDRTGYFNVSGCNISIANTLEVDVFDVLTPNRILFNDNTVSISFSGNNCSFIQAIAETKVEISGNLFNKTATNVDFWDFFALDYNGSTTFGAVADSTISNNTFYSATSKWINFVSGGSTGSITRTSITGNSFQRLDKLQRLEKSVVNSNQFTGGNSTTAIFIGLSDHSVFSDNALVDNGPNVTLDSTCKSTGNLGYQGTTRRGTFTGSGDGSNRVFAITHGLPTSMTPAHVSIAPKNFVTSSAGSWYYQVGTGTVEIVFNTAPGSGTNNVVFTWEVVG